MVRYSLRFDGRVQGVGFRATTVSVASDFAVTGFVRNEMDGSVLVVAEGEPDELDRFVLGIYRSCVGQYIHHENRQTGEATGRFTRFTITY
jgi:acylphosphatase